MPTLERSERSPTNGDSTDSPLADDHICDKIPLDGENRQRIRRPPAGDPCKHHSKTPRTAIEIRGKDYEVTCEHAATDAPGRRVHRQVERFPLTFDLYCSIVLGMPLNQSPPCMVTARPAGFCVLCEDVRFGRWNNGRNDGRNDRDAPRVAPLRRRALIAIRTPKV